MGIRRPLITKKIGKHRYALLKDRPYSLHDAQVEADKLRKRDWIKSVRIIELSSGYFIYHYPQYPD